MLKLTVLLILSQFWSFVNLAQNNIWIANSTSDATAESMDVVLDDAGNSYITGYISGDTEFQQHQIDVNTGFSEVVVAKIDADGNYIWVKKFGGNQADRGLKIALTNSNEIVITGTFYGNITFGNVVLSASSNSKDIFIAKLSNNGDVIWARKDGGSLGDNVYGLAIDNQNNIITTGQFEGTATYGNESFSSQLNLETNLPSFDAFIAKYDANGLPIWSKAAYAEFDDRGLAVTTDAQNNIYFAGQFSDTINFFGLNVLNQINNAGFVTKFDPSGNRLWVDKLAAGQVLIYDIAIDNQQKLVLTGDFLGQLVVWANENYTIVSNPYSKKVFVLKLSTDGAYIWGKANGSSNDVSSRTLAIDTEDNIYIGGYFRCNFDEYRDSTGTAHFQSAGFKDIFVSKFSSTGSLLWKRQAGGQKEEICWGIDVNEIDKPVITGSYTNLLNFPAQLASGLSISNNIKQLYFQNPCPDNMLSISVLGDESINFFTAKILSTSTPLYNYYQYASGTTSLQDSIPMNIIPDVNFVNFCLSQRASMKSNTSNCLGPLYNGNWNNGVLWSQGVSAENLDGLYIVEVNRLDGCYTNIDSILIDYHPNPAIPELTDNHLVHDSTLSYTKIEVCYPDTLQFWFTNLVEENTYSVKYLNLDSTVVFSNDIVFQSNHSQKFIVSVTSEYGCVSSKAFEYFQQTPFDSIKLYLKLEDIFDNNDSIQVCEKDKVQIWALDTLTNPFGNLIKFQEPKAKFVWQVTTNGNPASFTPATIPSEDSVSVYISPQVSGWYKVNYHVDLGYSNELCYDTIGYDVVDSFYLEVMPKPVINVFGEELLCPDSYNFLYTDSELGNLVWSGIGILWTSADSDSIKLNESGYYSLSGVFNYSQISCPFQTTVLISEKQPPLIQMDPIDGLICPHDSVLFTLSEEGLSYQWLGPEGFVISTNDSVYEDIQGFYACIFTDLEGCQLLTNQAEIRQYITPFLEFSPSNIVCKDEPITLSAIHGGLATVNWHSPINSNQETVVVNQPGTYYCDVTQCGFTVLDSITLINGSFDLILEPLTSTICYSDSVHVQVSPSNLGFYQWSNGLFNETEFYTNQAGSYSVFAVNSFGCQRYSDTIEIGIIEGTSPPLINDLVICTGQDATITHQSNFNLVWYSAPNENSQISAGPEISFQNLIYDTIIYAAYSNPLCPLSFAEVSIDALQPLMPPQILGDTILCTGDDVLLSVNELEHVSYSWTYQNTILSTNHELLIPEILFQADSLIHLQIQDICTNNQNSVTLEINNFTPVSLQLFDDTLCPLEQLIISPEISDNQIYFWLNGSDTINASSLNINYFDLASENLAVLGSNSDACLSPALNFQVTLLPVIDIQISASDLFCQKNEITLSSSISSDNLNWILPNNSQIQNESITIEELSSKDNGNYILQLIDQYACLHDDTLAVTSLNLPQIDLGNDTILCKDFAFDLAVPSENYSFLWNDNFEDSIFTPNGIDPILLTAIDSNGCIFTDTISVIHVDCSGHAGNFTTDNGDGINDYFTIFNAEYMQGTFLRIFNRWGNVIHEEVDYMNNFNTSELSEGVYFYEFYPFGINGKKEIGFFHLFKGK